MLMELDVFTVLGKVLGLYANLAISWLMAVVADLVINKPLGLSPRGIEFRARYLYDVNPVGVGAMGVASVLCDRGAPGRVRAAGAGVLGADRAGHRVRRVAADRLGDEGPLLPRAARRRSAPIALLRSRPSATRRATRRYRTLRCVICERDYEGPDMAHCPAYQGPICSLCCSLDARCGDLCKPTRAWRRRRATRVHALLPRRLWPAIDGGLGALAGADGCRCRRCWPACARCSTSRSCARWATRRRRRRAALRQSVISVFAMLLLASGIVGWWAGADAPEPPRRAGGEQPPDAGAGRADGAADAGDRVAPPHRRRAAARQGRRRRRQPGQEPLHLDAEPRAAHAAQQRDRLRAAARRRPRAAARTGARPSA